MSKLLAAIVASAFALSSASGFAADTARKKEELTKSQRADMRDRANKLLAQRAAKSNPAKKGAQQATKTKKPPAKKGTKATTPDTKKAKPKK